MTRFLPISVEALRATPITLRPREVALLFTTSDLEDPQLTLFHCRAYAIRPRVCSGPVSFSLEMRVIIAEASFGRLNLKMHTA